MPDVTQDNSTTTGVPSAADPVGDPIAPARPSVPFTAPTVEPVVGLGPPSALAQPDRTAAQFTPTPLPPFPAPHPHQIADEKRRPTALMWACAIAACAALLFAWMWQRASNDADAASRDAAAARVERNDAAEALLNNDVELAAMRDELAAARASTNDTDELNDRIAELEADIEQLEAENADLQAFIDTAAAAEVEDAVDEAEPAAEPATAEEPTAEADVAVDSEPVVEDAAEPVDETPAVEAEEPTDDAAPFDITSGPQFERYIGEVLSSRTGSSQLGAEQSQCFGGAIIDDIGLDALGAGLNNAATTAANNAVVAAMQRAIVTCNLDPALVFG